MLGSECSSSLFRNPAEDKEKVEEGCPTDARHCEGIEGIGQAQDPSHSSQHARRNSIMTSKTLSGSDHGSIRGSELGSELGSVLRAGISPGCEWKLPKHLRGAYCVLQRVRKKMPYAEYFNAPNRHRPHLAMPHTGHIPSDLTWLGLT